MRLQENILTRIEESYNDTRASAHELNELQRVINDAFDDHIQKLDKKWGKVGGGEGKLEFYGKSQDRSAKATRF